MIDIGTLLAGTYLLEDRLGAGGMGIVFRASHLRLPLKHVAIKVLRREASDDDTQRRFRREAEILARLSHPNIIAVLDFNVTADGIPYLVFEYVRGRTLADHPGPLSLDATLPIVRQIAAALTAAHAAGVIHRDLKPHNVMLTDDGAVKVLDFGISKLLGHEHTGERALLGTPQYMSPEQAHGRAAEVDGRADVFALGAITYELLGGRPAFTGATLAEVMFKVAFEPPPPLTGVPDRMVRTVERALAKEPAARFPTPGAFVTALEDDAPHAATLPSKHVSWVRPVVASVLIGRDLELAELGELMGDARRGDGKLALVGGEPGIGKSKLVEATMERARDGGWAIAWGRAWEAGGAPAYWPWIQIVRALHRERPELAIPAELTWMLGAAASTRAVADDRFVLFDATLQLLAAAAVGGRPLALVFEDLHAADHPSLLLLAFICTHLAGVPIAIVGTYRTAEARMTPEIGATIDKLARLARMIAPRRLDRDDIAQLAGARSAETIDAVFRASEGNPLFATEILRIGGDGATVPETVRAAIRAHIAHLSPDALELAQITAVVGRELAVAQVAELAGRPERDALLLLRTLVDRGVLVDTGARTFRFAHSLIAETLLHDLDPARREELHGRLADLLEREPGALAEVTHHRFEAGEAQRPAAVAAARRAAEAATRTLAHEEAVALLERALAATPGSDRAARCELSIELAHAQALADRIDAGRATCLGAADLARALGSPELFARTALAYGKAFTAGIVDRVLVTLLEEALAAIPAGDSALRAQLLARLGSAQQPANDPGPPMQLARDAIAMARRLGDDRTLLSVLFGAMAALLNFAHGAETAPLDREAIELARRFDEPVMVLRSAYRLMLDLLDTGDLDGASEAFRTYCEAATGFRLARIKLDMTLMRALLDAHHGKYADYVSGIAEARRIAALPALAGVQTLTATMCGMVEQRVNIVLGSGFDPERYLAMHAGAWHRMFPLSAAPFAHAQAGQLERARAAWARLDMGEVVRYQYVFVFVLAAHTAIALDDREAAETLYAALADHDGRWSVATLPTLSLEGPVSAYRFLLADYLGLPTAQDHAAQMLREIRGAGATLLLARFLAEHARARSTPRETAAASLAEARAVAAAAGLPMDELFARCTPSDAPAPRAVTPPADAEAVVLASEGEVWLVSYAGASCRVRTSRGVELLAKLVAEPAREHHVLDLVGAQGADDGDAGEVIDRAALAAYRKRAAELRAELEEAAGWNDRGRRERAEAELEHLEAEVRAAAGLGGRIRKNPGAAERARINVRRRVADAIARIAEAAPAIGRHLDTAIRTGTHCSYDPRRVDRAR